MSISEKWSF